MANVKHVGKTTNGQRVVVLFRTVPNETQSCLVTETSALPREYHDRVMELLESEEGQQAAELADLLSRRFFSDGNNVLNTLHTRGYIKKVPTKNVYLTPNTSTSVPLSEVNNLIHRNEQTKQVSAENYTNVSSEPVVVEEYPTPVASAVTATSNNILLAQAEFHEKEAARLRQLANASIDAAVSNVKEQKKRGRPPKTTAVG